MRALIATQHIALAQDTHVLCPHKYGN